MFGLMKMLRKETETSDDRTNLADLSIGCTVGFGFLPQTNISGNRMEIKAVNTYRYGEDAVTAYVLENGQSDINLIISRDESGDDALAISQRIEPRLFPLLFSKEPQSWFAMHPGDSVETSHKVMGMQQSWIASRYIFATEGKGTVTEGDYRPLKELYNTHSARAFDYVILLDEAGGHALEAEKYADGAIIVYSTVYRPATDIGEIARETPRKPAPLPATDLRKYTLQPVEKQASQKTADIIEITGKPLKEIAKAQPQPQATTEEVLALDRKLASGLLSEAQSNNVSIAELIRKVIDLPAEVDDKVMVSFSLSEKEQAALAKRYEIDPSDYETVKKNVVKELQEFLGVKG